MLKYNMSSNVDTVYWQSAKWRSSCFLGAQIHSHRREGKNQEDLIWSEMDLLCEPDVSGLLPDLLCTLGTSCGPATSIILPSSDLL